MKKIIITEDQLHKKFILKEYLDKNYMMPLKNNLTMEDEKKIWFNIYRNLEDFYEYIGEMEDYHYGDGKKPKELEKLEKLDYDSDEEKKLRERLTNRVLKKYKKEAIEFCASTLNLYAETFNSNIMFKNVSLFKNNWVIHLTNKPFDIILNGFNGLTNNEEIINRLWRTYYHDYEHENGKGYCFAFDVNDGKIDVNYGDYGLIFRTSGLKTYNKIDHENQVIFNAENANLNDCILMHISKQLSQSYCPYEDDVIPRHDCVYEIIDLSTKKIYYKSDDYKKAVNWAINNFRQYKKLNATSKRNKDNLNKPLKEFEKCCSVIEKCVNGKYITFKYDKPRKRFILYCLFDDFINAQKILDNEFNLQQNESGEMTIGFGSVEVVTRIDAKLSFDEKYMWGQKYDEEPPYEDNIASWEDENGNIHKFKCHGLCMIGLTVKDH